MLPPSGKYAHAVRFSPHNETEVIMLDLVGHPGPVGTRRLIVGSAGLNEKHYSSEAGRVSQSSGIPGFSFQFGRMSRRLSLHLAQARLIQIRPLGDASAQRWCTNAVIASTRTFCAAQNAVPFKLRSIGGICELSAIASDGEPTARMLASVVVEFAALGVIASSGTAYTRSGSIAATVAVVRRRCAKMSIAGQTWITAKLEIAAVAMAPTIPATLSRVGEK